MRTTLTDARQVIGTAVVAAGIAWLAAPAAAAQTQQKFPVKPVRLVVPFAPGSQSDVLARIIGPKLSELWGQPVLVETRTGAGGTIAAALVARGIADGGAGSARLGVWMRPWSDP